MEKQIKVNWDKWNQQQTEEKLQQIVDYCRPHLDQMWAATIVGKILDCDFRDAKQTLEEYDKEYFGDEGYF